MPPPRLSARSTPLIGAAVFLCSVAYLYPFWDRLGVDSDEAKIILDVLRILDGERMYIDFFEFIPPGLHAIIMAVFYVAGQQMQALRIAMVLIGAGIVAATWACAYKATHKPVLAFVPASLGLVFGISHWCIASIHWVSTLFALLATWALFDIGRTKAPWRPWFLAGLTTGSVLLVAQHKGVALLGAGGVLVVAYIVHAQVHLGRPKRRAAGPEDAYGLGIALILAPLVVGLLLRGQLQPMLSAAFGWTLKGYGVANAISYGHGAGTLFGPGNWLGGLPVLSDLASILTRLLLLFLAPLALAAATGRGAALFVRLRSEEAWPFLVVGVTGLAMWATAWSRPDILHLLTVVPWGLLGITLFLAEIERSRVRNLVVSSAIVCALLVCTWGVSNLLTLRQWRSLPLGSLGHVRYPPALAPNYSRGTSDFGQTIDFVQRTVPEGEPIFVYPYAPFFYYLADRPNPTRYNIVFPGYQGEEAVREVIDSLESNQIRLIILDPTADATVRAAQFPGYDSQIFSESPLTKYIESRYDTIQQYGNVRILWRK